MEPHFCTSLLITTSPQRLLHYRSSISGRTKVTGRFLLLYSVREGCSLRSPAKSIGVVRFKVPNRGDEFAIISIPKDLVHGNAMNARESCRSRRLGEELEVSLRSLGTLRGDVECG